MLMSNTQPSFLHRGGPLTVKDLAYIHSIYALHPCPLDFIVKLKSLVISLMHYEKAAQLRDIEKTILNGFKWTL